MLPPNDQDTISREADPVRPRGRRYANVLSPKQKALIVARVATALLLLSGIGFAIAQVVSATRQQRQEAARLATQSAISARLTQQAERTGEATVSTPTALSPEPSPMASNAPTRTSVPLPTNTVTQLPTRIATQLLSFECPGALPSRLSIGVTAIYNSGTDQFRLAIRVAPGRENEALEIFSPSQYPEVVILDGPVCNAEPGKGNWIWWKVRVTNSNEVGWAIESTTTSYYLTIK